MRKKKSFSFNIFDMIAGTQKVFKNFSMTFVWVQYGTIQVYLSMILAHSYRSNKTMVVGVNCHQFCQLKNFLNHINKYYKEKKISINK